MALKLGKHEIDFPFILAPMAGITNAPFRRLMRELGTGVVVSELVSATGMKYGSQKTLDLCEYFEEERPVAIQIFGDGGEDMARAAKDLEARGLDFVDINLGCPVPKIVSKGGGSAMCRDPQKLYLILKEVKDAITIPLTIKIRTGWDACSINASECVAAAAEAGVAWVAIHGRTRAQAYEGLADWDLIAKVKQSAKIPIIGNGDILTAEQAIFRMKESGCDGVMIGRGALRNPFIFQQIAKLTDRFDLFKYDEDTEERAYWRLIERHTVLMREKLGDYYTGIQLRKFMTWFSAGMEGASKFRQSLYAVPAEEETLSQIILLGKEFFDRPNARKSPSYLKEPFLKGGHG